MKKRNCKRFNIPGTVLYYKNRPRFFGRATYSDGYYPVINMSKGGVSFLCNHRLKAGSQLILKILIPGIPSESIITGEVKWISKNPEQSYRYQTGLAFSPYGDKKDQNPLEILTLFETLENRIESIDRKDFT